jgi:flap endonuclease-1
MGIRGLTSLIRKYVPDAITTRSLSYFKGSVIAIDTSILLYKFRYSNTNPNSHINGFLSRCLCYIKNGILPIFILDGRPPPEKNNILIRRNKKKKRIEFRIQELKNKLENESANKMDTIHKINKLNKQIINVNNEHHKDSKELLEYMGFRVISSPGEAESVCAYLQKENIVNFTYSDDMDILALGCRKVLRSNTKNNSFLVIDLDIVLQGLKLNFDEFIDLCILCGCDYCPTIPRVNYDVAYMLIKKHKNIENFIEKNKDYDIPDNYNYKKAREIFKEDVTCKLINNDNININNIQDPKIDEEKFLKFLIDKKYKKKYIINYIRKFNDAADIYLPKVSSESSLSSMDNYFQ